MGPLHHGGRDDNSLGFAAQVEQWFPHGHPVLIVFGGGDDGSQDFRVRGRDIVAFAEVDA